jgi:hypothetical protein
MADTGGSTSILMFQDGYVKVCHGKWILMMQFKLTICEV